MATATLLPPPEGGLYGGKPADTVPQLMEALNNHAGAHGYALVRRNASNYREGKPTLYYIVCDRGKKRATQSQGVRTAGTRKIDCPFKGKICASRANDWRWTFHVLNGTHNHGPSSDKAAHPIHRRLAKGHERQITAMHNDGIRPQEILSTLESDFPGHPFSIKDIQNFIQRQRLDKQKD